MGKAALIIVLATFLSVGTIYVSRDDSMIDRTAEEAEYEEMVVARETAKSAFNLVVSEVKKNFDGYRSTLTNQVYGKGMYDISASDAAGSGVTVSATGKYGDYEYQITGIVDRSGSRLLDALTIDGPVDQFKVKNDALISGIDTNPDGSRGSGPNVHAILTTSQSTFNMISNAVSGLLSLLGIGVEDDAPDVVKLAPNISLDDLESAIRNFEGDDLTTYDDDETMKNGSFGSAGHPKVLRVDGDLTLKGSFTGYGVLYVTGNLKIRDTARWNGLVLVNNPNGSSHQIRDDGAIYGALILRSAENVGEEELDEDDEDRGLAGGHFDTDVFDEADTDDYVYHQHKYDDKFDAIGVDLLSGGCGEYQSGGLCWNNVFDDDDIGPVKIEFVNNGYSLGTYKIKVGNDLYTGVTTNGFELEVEDPSDISMFEIDFLSLMALRGTDPWTVWASTSSRDNSFGVRIFELPEENAGNGNGGNNNNNNCQWWENCSNNNNNNCQWWENCSNNNNNNCQWWEDCDDGPSEPVLVYELDIYHHTSGMNGSGMDGGDGNAGDYDWGSDGDGDGEFDDGQGTVQICHIPPGNSANKHTLNVSMAAVIAHLNHGDQAGACDGDVITEDGDELGIKIQNDGKVIYSSSALRSLSDLLQQIRMDASQIVVSRTAEKPRLKDGAAPKKR